MLFRSGEFWITLLIWALCFSTWSCPNWWEQPISVLPNLLGFTLAGFAIFLGFGNDDFKEMIASEDHYKSAYLSVSASFVTFVFTQCAALLWALVAKAFTFSIPACLYPIENILIYLKYFFWGFGYFLFIYGIMLSVISSLRLFRVSRWYNDFLVKNSDKQS